MGEREHEYSGRVIAKSILRTVGGSADVKSEACASSEVMFWLVSVKDWR